MSSISGRWRSQRDPQSRVLDLAQAHGERFHSAQRQTTVIRRHGAAQHLLVRADLFPSACILHRHRSQQQVAMSAHVFRKGLHGDVNPMSEGVEVHARGPGVVQDNRRPVCMRRFADRGHILHFHGDGAGTLAPDQPRVLFDERGQLVTEKRIVVTDLNSEPAQHVVGKLAIGPVDAPRQQDMIARVEEGEVNQRNGALAAGRNQSAITAFQLADPGCEFHCGRRAIETVGVADFILVPVVANGGGVWEYGCGRAIDGDVEGAKSFGQASIEVDQLGFPAFVHSSIIGSRG